MSRRPWSLTLGTWPPVASHLACLVLGFAIANLSWRPRPRSLELGSTTVLIALPADLRRQIRRQDFPKGAKVFPLKRTNGWPRHCRLSNKPFVLFERTPRPVLAARYAQREAVAQFLELARKDRMTLLDPYQAKGQPPCRNKPTISYGRSGTR